VVKMVVAAAQLGPADEDKGRNVERVVALLARSREVGAELVSFPELALTPYFCLDPEPTDSHGDSLESTHVRRVREAVEATGISTVLPLAERDASGTYNAALVIGPDGGVIGRYQKVHLPYAEQNHFLAGREFTVTHMDNYVLGVLICADRGFPESWRVLGLRGAEVVCAPYNTSTHQAHGCPPHVSEIDWARDLQVTRMRAAAMSNGFYVIAPGKGGRERDVDYIADSMIISPWGEVIARARTNGDELVVAEIDLEEVAKFRKGGRYERRVPAAYAAITATDPDSFIQQP